MPVDPLDLWKTTLAALPPSDGPNWTNEFSNWYASRIIGISPDPSALVAPGFVFTFGLAAFQSGLAALVPTTDPVSGINGFASAWESAILASTVVLTPPADIQPPNPPATTFVVGLLPTITIIDPASIVAGKTKLLELTSALPTDNPLDSQFPVKFREATLLLTISVNGYSANPAAPPPYLSLAALNIPLV